MRMLIEEVVEALSARIRISPAGAKSLAHVCVVVPTAQSGRRLRLALAQKFGALVPPAVRTPETVALNHDDPTLATRTDDILAFRTAVGDLERARQLADIRRILEPAARSFADVADNLRIDFPEEAERWLELAEIEGKFLADLAARGKTDRLTARKTPCTVSDETEEVLRFDDLAALDGEKERPAALARDQVFPCATPADEAEKIAAYFAAVPPGDALPALCVADPEMFTEIEAAFRAKGLSIHNPATTRLATSPLGHLVLQIVALVQTQSYAVFSAFLRGGDVRRWIQRELKLSDADLTAALFDLDNRQAEYLPEKIDDIAPKTEGKLRAIFEFVKVQLRKRSVRSLLALVFRDFLLDEREASAREFAAAAEVVNRLLDECEVKGPDGVRRLDLPLFEMRIKESAYSLEPDEGDVILTDGWMELPFLSTRELVIAGFQEGCVPESVVGHPFLPDSLRQRLGLPDNRQREARDRAILRRAVETRDHAELKIFFHSLDSKGDVLKPSRLLFETTDDRDLVARVRTFTGLRAGTNEGVASDLPEAWKLQLPIPPAFAELKKISPTRLDSYLRCPFTHYLKEKTVLGDKRLDDRAEELASWEYGNFAHNALEAFGNSPLKDSADAASIAAFLEENVDAQLTERFGLAVPAIVNLQGESVKRRLRHFAAIQAKRRADGWEIRAVERRLEVTYGHTRVSGKCDRIDCNPATGEWCVIDYKTWDSADKAASFETKKGGTRVWKSVQLPLYCAMLNVLGEEPFAAATLENISSCYCVLGKTADDVVFTEPMVGGYVPEAEELVRKLIGLIERGVFWPPTRADEWKYDYADWLFPRPEESVSTAWIADQEARHE